MDYFPAEKGSGCVPYRPRVRHQPIPAGTKEKKSGMVVSANCAAFADDIMAETELFGYVEGTFTGAQRGGKPGLFQEAHEKFSFWMRYTTFPNEFKPS